MSGQSRGAGSKFSGPCLDDCERLWGTIVTELVTDAGIRFLVRDAKLPAYRTCVQVWSPGFDTETGKAVEHIWATKELPLGSVAFTYMTFYGLLLAACVEMEHYLGGQMELPAF